MSYFVSLESEMLVPTMYTQLYPSAFPSYPHHTLFSGDL